MTEEKRAFSAWSPTVATRFIEDWEGRRLVAYRCPSGVWTCGVGHTDGVREGMTCTDAQADEWLIDDIRSVVSDLSRYINHSVTRGQFIALVSLGFNLGAYTVITRCPKLMRAINSGDMEEAATQFLDCDRATENGTRVRVEGLTRRRQAEARIFLGETER